MEIEIKIKDTNLNQHIFQGISLEMFKDLLINNPEVLLNIVNRLEKTIKVPGTLNTESINNVLSNYLII